MHPSTATAGDGDTTQRLARGLEQCSLKGCLACCRCRLKSPAGDRPGSSVTFYYVLYIYIPLAPHDQVRPSTVCGSLWIGHMVEPLKMHHTQINRSENKSSKTPWCGLRRRIIHTYIFIHILANPRPYKSKFSVDPNNHTSEIPAVKSSDIQ